jgi:hypothetical protein
MSKPLRKNASLATVAAEARKRADAAYAEWRKYEAAKREDPGNSFWRGCQADAHYRRYSDLNEIASHLERLSA